MNTTNLSRNFAAQIRQSNLRVLKRKDEELKGRKRKQFELSIYNYNDEDLYVDQDINNIQFDYDATVNEQLIIDQDINNIQFDHDATVNEQLIIDENINNIQFEYDETVDEQILADQDISNTQFEYDATVDEQLIIDEDIRKIESGINTHERWFTGDSKDCNFDANELDREFASKSDGDSDYEMDDAESDEGYAADDKKSDEDDDNDDNDDDDDERQRYYKFNLKGYLRRKIDDLDFNVVEKVEGMIRSFNNDFSNEEFKSFSKDEAETTTLGGFSRELQDFIAVNQIPQRAQIDLLRILERNFGQSYNIPLDKTIKKEKIVYKNLLSKFTKISNRCIVLDVCKEFCCVFAGDNENKRYCPICNSPRYYKCSNGNCAKNPSQQDNCTHSLENRTPLRTINYQCILPLFCGLAENEFFMKCVKYDHIKNRNYQFSDVTDGKCFKRNMEEMKTRYSNVINYRKIKEHVEELNINIAVNYDGVQIYRHKCGTFNPLLMTILNLPPSFRSKVGVGMFLLSLFTSKEKSEAEYFIFHKCLLQELQTLSKGYLYKFGNRRILIQVRLISLLLDTPMVTKQLKVPGHMAYAPCPVCGDIYGMSGNGGRKGGGSKRVGHRCYLDRKHFLRSWGQSEQCCPPGYYCNRVPDPVLRDRPNWIMPLNLSRGVTTICDNVNLDLVKSFLLDNKQEWVWHHNDSDFHRELNGFKKYLYYPHADYRPQIEYRRVSYDLNSHQIDDRQDGSSYQPWFLYLDYFKVEESINWCVFHAKMGAGRHTLKEFTNEAITDRKGPYKDYLKRILCHPYLYRVEQSNQGTDNLININSNNNSNNYGNSNSNSNNNVNDSDNIPDKKILEKLVKNQNEELSKIYGKTKWTIAKLPQDYLYRIPWKVSKDELRLMETYVNSLHVPSGLSDKFQLHDILSRLGQLRGAEVITIMEDLLEYILIPTTLPTAYKQYYSILSSDICKMGKPCIKNEREITKIFYKVVETIVLHEGMFPIFLSDFLFHELVDIVKHIKFQGPQKAFSTIGGERANSVLKKFVRTGGRNCTKTVLNSYLYSEAYTTSKAYSNELENSNIESGLCLSLRTHLIFHSKDDGNVSHYEYNPFVFTMKKRDQFNDNLSPFEMANILSTLLFEVEKQSASEDDAKRRSTLYYFYSKWLYDKTNADIRNLSKIGQHDRFYRYVVDNSANPSILNDFPVIGEFLALQYRIPKSCYQTCSIYGTKFSSRGMTERIKNSADYLRDMNDFRLNWWRKQQYSSWCQYRQKTKERIAGIGDCDFGTDQSGKQFAQVNGFFRVNLPSDTILNSVPLASISHRKTKEFQRVFRYEVEQRNIDGKSNLFIAATDIVPCRQLIAGFDNVNKPWKFRGNTGPDAHSKVNKCYIAYILCVPFDRKNDCITYCMDHNCYYNLTDFDNYQ